MTVTLCFFLLGAAIALRLISNALSPGVRNFPGPWPAKFTNFWRLWQVIRKRQPPVLVALHEKYGVAVRSGPNIIDISDPSLIIPVYGFKNDFVKSDMMKVWQVIKEGERIPFVADTQDRSLHIQLKRPVASIYSMSNVLSLAPFVDSTIKYFLKRLDDEFVQGQSRPCDLHNWLLYFSFDCLGELIFSRRLGFMLAGTDVDGILASQQKHNDYRSIVGQVPWLDQLLKKNPLYLKVAKPTAPLAECTARLLRARAKEKHNGPSRKDLYTSFLEARKSHPEVVSETSVVRYIMNTINGGADTTAVAMRSIIYHTLRNQSVLQRLRNELDDACLTYPPDFAAVRNLPYLDAVIREGLRIHPGPGFSLERVVPEEGLHLSDGRIIPGGCIVGMNPWGLHFTKSIFGDDCEKFRPERWLQQKGEGIEEFSNRLVAMKKADFSFSYGPRACLGRNMAQFIMYKAIASIFGLLNLELADPAREWTIEYSFLARQSDINTKICWRNGVDISVLTNIEN